MTTKLQLAINNAIGGISLNLVNREKLLEDAYTLINSQYSDLLSNGEYIKLAIDKINKIKGPNAQREISLLKAILEFIQEQDTTPKPTPTVKGNAIVGHDALLLWACDKEMRTMVNALLNAGAAANVKDVNGDTPLLVACSKSFITDAIIGMFVKNNANVNETNNLGMTPLKLCVGKADLILKLTQLGAMTGGRRLRLKPAAE
jgi:hypothetical protein